MIIEGHSALIVWWSNIYSPDRWHIATNLSLYLTAWHSSSLRITRSGLSFLLYSLANCRTSFLSEHGKITYSYLSWILPTGCSNQHLKILPSSVLSTAGSIRFQLPFCKSVLKFKGASSRLIYPRSAWCIQFLPRETLSFRYIWSTAVVIVLKLGAPLIPVPRQTIQSSKK